MPTFIGNWSYYAIENVLPALHAPHFPIELSLSYSDKIPSPPDLSPQCEKHLLKMLEQVKFVKKQTIAKNWEQAQNPSAVI